MIENMKCRFCGSEKIHRSQRKGLKEGLWYRFVLMAPYRCHDCGARYLAVNKYHRKRTKSRTQSFAEYLGLRGREYRLRQWTIAFIVTVILLSAAIFFLLRILE
jgi:hypothetical protein